MGRRPEQTFFRRRHTDGQQAHEKILNIANYQRSAKKKKQQQKKVRYYLMPVRMTIIKKSINSKYWRGCEEKEKSVGI